MTNMTVFNKLNKQKEVRADTPNGRKNASRVPAQYNHAMRRADGNDPCAGARPRGSKKDRRAEATRYIILCTAYPANVIYHCPLIAYVASRVVTIVVPRRSK